MALVLVTGAARSNSIAAGIIPRLVADGWNVITSDLESGEYPCDLATTDGPEELVDRITAERGALSGLVLSHAHDVQSGILDTTAASFDTLAHR